MLLVDRDAEELARLSSIMGCVIGDLDPRLTLEALPADGQYDIVVANYDPLTPEERRDLSSAFSGFARKTRLLWISSGRCHDDFETLFGNRTLTNLLAKNGEVHADDFIVTVKKILRRDIFGIEKYFVLGTSPVAFFLTRSSERARVLESAEAFAVDAGVHSRLRNQFCTVVDELVSNALYNAPRAPDGRSRYAHVQRAVEVVLEPGEVICVKFCRDGRRLGVSATDPFGALSPTEVLDCLARCFRGGDAQVVKKEGGAGLGLYYVLEGVSHLAVNISAGTCTEFVGIIDASSSYREFAARNKSLNIFTAESNDATPEVPDRTGSR